MRITYIEQDAPRGLAHARADQRALHRRRPVRDVSRRQPAEQAASPHFVEEFVRERPAAQILLAARARPADVRRRASSRDGRVVRLVEKPQEPKSDLALVGVYMFSPAVFDSVKRIRPSFRNELEITDAIQDLIDRGLEVRPHIVDGWWKDTGKLEDMLEANRLILDTYRAAHRRHGRRGLARRGQGRHRGGRGRSSTRSSAGRRSSARGARIVNAYVGPFTSIMNDAEIRDSEIEHSIVLEGSSISNLANRVEDSLIGKNVRDLPRAGEALRLPLHARRQLRGRHPLVRRPWRPRDVRPPRRQTIRRRQTKPLRVDCRTSAAG